MAVPAGDGYPLQPAPPAPPFTRFKRLSIDRDWRQFSPTSFDLTSQVTILTGANNAGKSTILSLLGSHFSWNSTVIGSPVRAESGGFRYSAESHTKGLQNAPEPHIPMFGKIEYADGYEANLGVQSLTSSASFNFRVLPKPGAVPGIYLTATRAPGYYQPSQSIPPSFSSLSKIHEEYILGGRSKETGSPSHMREDARPMLLMKEALLAAALYGEGNSSVVGSAEAGRVWIGFQDVLREILPAESKFIRLLADPPEVIVETEYRRFAIEAASGGVLSLLDAAWQIFIASMLYDNLTVCFDEPENHLHPTMQRALLPSLLKAFPSANFIVATHSPFIVTSVRDARVYALTHTDNGRIIATEVDLNDKAAPAERTLRDVLGVPNTLPIWADREIQALIAKYVGSDTTATGLAALLEALEQRGLDIAAPEAVRRMVDARTQPQAEPEQ